MRNLLAADFFRMVRSKWLWLCQGAMLILACAFVAMQYTAMDYTVALSRVIFLPLSFYGMISAAMVSLFAGEDFSDGFIRNKMIAGCSKRCIFASNLIICCLACIIIYLITTLFTALLGCAFFEIDVSVSRFLGCLLLGMGMCLAYGCIYCMITIFSGNRTLAAVLCVGLAFSLLCVCLHTNQVMVQPEYKNGMRNPAYVDGFAKAVYGFLHDLNPSGQAAQLSAMKIFNPVRWALCNVLWIVVAGMGSIVFDRKDIR